MSASPRATEHPQPSPAMTPSEFIAKWRVSELKKSAAAQEHFIDRCRLLGEGLLPFQPRQRYLLLDEHAQRIEDLPPDNSVTAQIALEQGEVESLVPVLRDRATRA